MSLIVKCKLCGASYDMDMEPPLSDRHTSPEGTPCETDWDTGWDLEEDQA